MKKFLVEAYLGRMRSGALPDTAARARAAAEDVARAGTPVRYVRAIFIPQDETCFYLFEAAAAAAVAEASRRAGLTCGRIVEMRESGDVR